MYCKRRIYLERIMPFMGAPMIKEMDPTVLIIDEVQYITDWEEVTASLLAGGGVVLSMDKGIPARNGIKQVFLPKFLVSGNSSG